jgi:hypothetical protein
VGTFSVVKTATVYHAQTSISTENKGAVEIVVTTDKKADAAQSITTPAVNLISAVENKERADGLTDSKKADTTKVPTTLVDGVVVEKTALETKTLTEKIHQTSVAPATNALESVSVEHNGAGGLNVKRIQGAEVNAVTQDKISTPLETVTIDKNTASTAATLGTVSQNNGSKISNKPTPGGNFESEKTGTVKTPWDSGELVVTKNIGGVFTEKTQRFRNQAAIPAATAGQLVKALENELASFDGEIMARLIESGANTGIVTVRSAIYEWKSSVGTARFPIWTTFTDSDAEPKITGYNFFQHELPYRRSVEVVITRKYSISHPAATAISGTWVSDNSGFANGGGKNYVNQVIELGEGLFAIEEKVLTTSDWVAKALLWTPLYSTTA